MSAADTLNLERAYLRDARAHLADMRAAAQRLDASKASSADSLEALAFTLARRVAALQDDPRTTLFFGRIDVADEPRPFYIGRRYIRDDDGDPIVLDWRAPMSSAFYRASRAEPMGVGLRRRFGVEHGELTAYEDEHLDTAATAETEEHSAILAAEIERPRSGPMRDIVSTIQPEQDVIVRSDVTTSICVQGAPGTGKTAVGLHRAAWLLYSFRERLDRTGVLVVGPNSAFLDHISAVLPALGELRVAHTTVSALVAAGGPVRAFDPADVAVLKGDSRMATVLERAVWSHVTPPTQPLIVPRGVRKWRIPAYEVAEIVDELSARGVRYAAAGAMLAHRLSHAVLLQMERAGESPDDRVQEAVAKSAPVRAYVKTAWPTLDPKAVLFELLSDPAALERAADGVLDPDEQRMLLWDKPARSKGAAKWSAIDYVLLDEIADLLERTTSLGHVILDEAQDLSAMQLRAVGRRCSTGSITVLGDIAQGTTPWATESWLEAMAHLGRPDHHLEVLDRGFRVPAAIIEFAAQLLPAIAPEIGTPQSVRDNPGKLEVRPGTDVAAAVAAFLASDREGNLGVILPDATMGATSKLLSSNGIGHGRLDDSHGDDEDHRVQLVPATVAKGLEFDHVIVVEPAAIAAAEPDVRTGLRRLYVVLTRAVSTLTVLHDHPLPELLQR